MASLQAKCFVDSSKNGIKALLPSQMSGEMP